MYCVIRASAPSLYSVYRRYDTLWDCSAYTSIRAQFMLKLKARLGGSYARFEAMSNLARSS